MTTLNADDRLWALAEPCLYYAYHQRYAEVQPVLARIVKESNGKALKTWGRISALASLSGHLPLGDLIDCLRRSDSNDAWSGAASVWVANCSDSRHTVECFVMLDVGLRESKEIASGTAKKMTRLFLDDDKLLPCPSLSLIELFFSALEQSASHSRADLYGFDKWLSTLATQKPAEALAIAEVFLGYIERSNHGLLDHQPLSQLLTSLFREAEELEESDAGAMLQRVIAIQDRFLALNFDGLQQWLRDAERP